MDQLPRLGKRELICLLFFTCNYVVSVWRGFLFFWVLGMGYVILLWHSLSPPYNYSLSNDNQADTIEAFISTAGYLDDLLNIDNPYFEGMVNQIYPPELKLNKANTSDTEAPFLDSHLSISNGFVSSKIYDKRHDIDLILYIFLFWVVMFHLAPLSHLIRFARV